MADRDFDSSENTVPIIARLLEHYEDSLRALVEEKMDTDPQARRSQSVNLLQNLVLRYLRRAIRKWLTDRISLEWNLKFPL